MEKYRRELVPTWLILSKLMGSPLAKLTIIIPVVGWILLFNNALITYVHHLFNLPLPDGAPISWKIHLFYIGLSLVGIASAMFRFRCPQVILENNSDSEYKNSELEIVTLHGIRARMREWGVDYKDDSCNREINNPGDYDSYMPRDYWLRENLTEVIDVLMDIFQKANCSRKLSRGFIIVVFVVGSILTLVPSVITFIFSCRIIYLQMAFLYTCCGSLSSNTFS